MSGIQSEQINHRGFIEILQIIRRFYTHRANGVFMLGTFLGMPFSGKISSFYEMSQIE
jgi:hypothetical protein